MSTEEIMTAADSINAEIKALGIVLNAIEGLTEEQRLFVLKTAVERFKAPLTIQPTPKGAPVSVKVHDTGLMEADVTPKQFMAARRPVNDIQRVACLAYYLTHHRDQQHFKTSDLTKLNLESASPKIGNAAQAVANATKNSGYLATAGGGKKQLTTLGEQVVEALPDQEAARLAMQEQAVTRPRRVRKKKTRP